MHRKLLAVAVLAALPLAASAQSSVTIYGILDASVAREDTDITNGGRTILASGNQSTSRIGFRGVEDLGSGLKALFNLEAGVNVDTGANDANLFGRRAVVGLQGAFGTVTLGREYTPIADVANASDINGQGFYGTNLVSFGAGKLTRRISNSVNYRSNPVAGGLKFGASYGLGETNTGPSLNLAGVSAEYASGNLYLGAGYHTFERVVAGDDKEWIIGAGYKFGAFEVRGNMMTAKLYGANNDYEQLNAGVSYTFGANKVMANLTRNEIDNGAKGNGFSLAFSHTLSKRTNVYAAYASMRNNNLGSFSIASAGSTVVAGAAGADPTALAIGVRHSF
ncbi:MAG: porin [Pseudomonadota bacterium]